MEAVYIGYMADCLTMEQTNGNDAQNSEFWRINIIIIMDAELLWAKSLFGSVTNDQVNWSSWIVVLYQHLDRMP